MIVVYHSNAKTDKILFPDDSCSAINIGRSVLETIQDLSQNHSDEIIVWCHSALGKRLDLDFIKRCNCMVNTLTTYNPTPIPFIADAIGYVESSPFINVAKDRKCATWQMSSSVGFAHASLFTSIKGKIQNDSNFDYYLNSLAKTFMPIGLFCYSEPNLLKGKPADELQQTTVSSLNTLYKFVKQHYKSRWVFLLFLDLLLYEKKFTLYALLKSLFYRKQGSVEYDLKQLNLIDHSGITASDTVDVLIPTIGRKRWLYDVLLDLKNQIHLPKNVLIIEQNADEAAVSELDYLTSESWPFVIDHVFTHTLGACNARNIGLEKIKSNWVFLADDDIRFAPDFLRDCLLNCKNYDKEAITLSCLKEGEKIPNVNPFQFQTFGSGCSFLSAQSIKNLRFDMRYEFGYGEDIDFGRKLRNNEVDITFFPSPKIFHLKAPVGGFRTKFRFEWEEDTVQPKPSPTIMLYRLLYGTKQQIDGYKTTLFFKYYRLQKTKNPFAYYAIFKKQWERSIFWATKLKNQNPAK